MIAYDPSQALISIHIPKCAGQSLTRVLKTWYGENFFRHYQRPGDLPPPRIPLHPGICIHGHFHTQKGLGIKDYYPEAKQFITFLRDPLEIHISNYFFWRTKARTRQIKSGWLQPGSPHDYRDLDDFFRMRPLSHIYKYMPSPVSFENCRSILDNKFVWIGFVENMQKSTDRLAGRLGFEPIQVDCINVSPRDELLSRSARKQFIEKNALAFEIYHTARKLFPPEKVSL
jgi:hypothetical protein